MKRTKLAERKLPRYTRGEEIANINPDCSSQNDWQHLSLRAVAKKSVYLHADRVAL